MMELAAHALAGSGIMMTGVYVAFLLSGATMDGDIGWVKLLGELPLTAAMLIGIIYGAKEIRKFIADRDAKIKEITETFSKSMNDMSTRHQESWEALSDKHDASTLAIVHELRSLSTQQAVQIEVAHTLTTEVASLQSHIQSCDAVQEVRRQHPHSHPHQHPQHHQVKPQP